MLPLEDPRRQAVISHLNVVFGNSEKSRVYWGKHLKQRLMEKFEQGESKLYTTLQSNGLHPLNHCQLTAFSVVYCL